MNEISRALPISENMVTFLTACILLIFPILQLLISFGLFKDSPWLMLAVSGLLILTIAILFWNFIEKPFLWKSFHYLAANQVGIVGNF